MFKTQLIDTVKIWPNTGQIPGLPQNPRFIKDERFEALVRSVIDDPEMLELRELLVVEYADQYVTIAGNMRQRACVYIQGFTEDEFNKIVESKKELPNFDQWLKAITAVRNAKKVPCKVLPAHTPVEKLKAYVIKDNVAFGNNDFDLLANEWDQAELMSWGMELTDFSDGGDDEPEAPPGMGKAKIVVEFTDEVEFMECKNEIRDLIEKYSSASLRGDE